MIIQSYKKFLAISIASIILISGVLFGFIRISTAADIDLEVNIVGEEEAPRLPIGGGGMPAEWFNPPKPPPGGFQVLINNGAEYTDSRIVTLNLLGGPDTKRMAISDFSDFRDTDHEDYTTSKTWDLCKGRTSCPEGEYTVYAKFYTFWGRIASEVVLDSIIYKKPIPEWIIEQIRTKINELSRRIADLIKQINQLFFKKEIEVKVPEIPPEEISPPEVVPERPPEKIVPPVKEGPIYLLKEYGKWLWQSVQGLWNKIWSGLQKIWPF